MHMISASTYHAALLCFEAFVSRPHGADADLGQGRDRRLGHRRGSHGRLSVRSVNRGDRVYGEALNETLALVLLSIA